MYFVVDSNNPDFQLIHYDMEYNYGIACKFSNFREEDGVEKFDITHYRRVISTELGFVYQAIGDIRPSIEVFDDDEYKYQIAVDLPAGEYDISDQRDCCGNVFTKKAASTGKPQREHIVDVHITQSGNIPTYKNNEKTDDNVLILSKHGPGHM